MENIVFHRIDNSEIDQIKELWEELKAHHHEKTTYFKERFENLNFEQRKKTLLEKADKGQLIIDVASINRGKIIAYCINSIDETQNGEVDSLYVDPIYRRNKIGDELMTRAIKWFDENMVQMRRIVVAEGNEEAFTFYQKFGFYHIFNTLQQK